MRVGEDGLLELIDHTEGELELAVLGGTPPFECARTAAAWREGRADRLPPPLAELALSRWRTAGLDADDVWVLTSMMDDTARTARAPFRPGRFDELAAMAQELTVRFGRMPTPEELATHTAA